MLVVGEPLGGVGTEADVAVDACVISIRQSGCEPVGKDAFTWLHIQRNLSQMIKETKT